MDWSETIVGWLSGQTSWAYHGDAPLASEPAALAALALVAHGRDPHAALDWLVGRQGADGSVGITLEQTVPGWPTAQAVLAWALADRHASSDAARYTTAIARGTDWLLTSQGVPLERNETLGHDSTLVGWPWVEGTHSWIEPTAWAVLALKAVGLAQHARTARSGSLARRSLASRRGLQFRQHVCAGPAAFAPSAIERHLPVGAWPAKKSTTRASAAPAIISSSNSLARPRRRRSAIAYSGWPLTTGDRPTPARCWPRRPSECWSAIAALKNWPCWHWLPKPPIIR